MNIRRFVTRNTAVSLLALGILTLGVLILWGASLRIPDLNTFDERIVRQSTKIYDRTGEILLFDVHENVQRTVIPFEEISRHVKNATVAIEDAEFYGHSGVKISSTLRAIATNILNADVFSGQGGSTITQQVVKNSLLTPEKLISRKLKEWVLSIKLEQVLSKEEILTLYLNEVPYGGNIYGVEEAAQSFFGKTAQDLTLAESAYLAALPQAPTYYSPYGNNTEALERRKSLVLKRMLEDGFITEEEREDALNEEVVFIPRADSGIKAPHFVVYVREYLERVYGERAIEEDGLRIITTLDYDLQKRAEEIVRRYALSNEENYNAENAALIAINPQNGHILTMVGSRDYFDEEIEGNFNVTIAHRQPGSSFKPFVYATAFKKGYTPETVVFDLSTEFSTECAPDSTPLTPNANCYRPGNYDNTFRGPVTFRNALAQSINIPAVKVLYLAGLTDSLKTAKDLGIQSLTNIGQYGLTLVLGGGEVSPLDMASAYGVFANDGVRNTPTSILRIEDANGNILEEFRPRPSQVLDNNIARTISDVLTDNVARTPAFGANSYLYFGGRDVAAKTGTTNDYRDAWIVGYTPSISVAAWAGNNDNSPMEKRVAGFIVAPLWNEFMQEALVRLPRETFREPKNTSSELKPVLRGVWMGGESYLIDSITGKRATEFTPQETLKEIVIRSVHSILYWVDTDDPTGPAPRNPGDDPQFVRWESPVRAWALERGLYDETNISIPDEEDELHIKNNLPKISITGILSSVYEPDIPIHFSVKNSGKFDLRKIEVYINGRYIGKLEDVSSFTFSFVPNNIDGIKEENTLRVVATDEIYGRDEKTTTFRVSI